MSVEADSSADIVPVPAGRSIGMFVRRWLIPKTVVSLYAFVRWGAMVSASAEVELSPNLRLGRRTVISSYCKVKVTDGVFATGERCGFSNGCFVDASSGGVILGDDVICGPNVVIVSCNYRYDELETPLEQQGLTSQGIRIGRNTWIGANCVILDGSEIGENCIVAAGSVVNRRFPADCIIQGNPAKLILKRKRG